MGTKKNKRKAKSRSHPYRIEKRHLRGKGVALTPLKRRDLATLMLLEHDPMVAARFGWDSLPASRHDCLAQIQSSKKMFKRGTPSIFAVRKKADSKLIGILQIRWGDDGRVELCWSFLPRYRDSKLFYRSCNIVSSWCLDQGAERVWSVVVS